MLDTPILVLIWTFNFAALALAFRGDWLKQVVLNSWHLILLLVGLELAYSAWALATNQPAAVVLSACWLGLNLMVTVNAARKHARFLQPSQIVLLCSWWLGLLGMMVAALHQAPEL